VRTKTAKVRESLILRISDTIALKVISSTAKNVQVHNGFMKQLKAKTKRDQFADQSWLVKRLMVMRQH
jgi:hypothetical protein